ncbi:hypothetical protein BN8_06351 [Fibrisoma limi BUZ 3]|uniref:Uncharacterized protein n=1 Tax=Fibrisoma limi BUZ 3 TaxID=1185876 RepID=I2GST1_9BACT|nr:hypothetical protein [Fibrisoma limi]CCH56960.1 hypothetical protein BN8_06351 [Fibrisoma limi BUZ 3]
MTSVFKAVDQQTKQEVTPINLQTAYKPEIGHVIDTTNGPYEVKGIAEIGVQRLSATEVDEPVTRVALSLQKVDKAL